MGRFHILYWEVSRLRGMRDWRALYSWTPDYQGFSFAFTCLCLPLVAEFLLLIWDYNGFWGAQDYESCGLDTQ